MNPQQTSHRLIERILGKRSRFFSIEVIAPDHGRDVYEMESRKKEVILRGNNSVSITSALNRYLKESCNAHISWNCGDQLRLPSPLPSISSKLRVVSPHKFRYAYNYCTHGYTMAWWEWPEWERELDFLSLNGVNQALIIVGQEQVWINVLKRFGYKDAEVRQWLVMPAYQPWQYMSNIEGFGGPVPRSLVERRVELARKILARMRELGMEPVLQGYYGIVPSDFRERFPKARIHAQGMFNDSFKRPDMLDPTDPLFEKMAAAFYQEQERLYGRAGFFGADPFHEGGDLTGIDLPDCGRRILGAMQAASPGSTWVLQSWQDNPRQVMIDALDKDRLLVLDLFCEDTENWRKRNNFNGTPWLWCTIQNFGGNTGMCGQLDVLTERVSKACHDPDRGRLRGIGTLTEGSQTNPVVWDLFFENAWRDEPVDLGTWLNGYAHRRYGADIPAARRAWEALRQTVYGTPGTHNSAVCARPTLNEEIRARFWGTTDAPYDPARLAPAWRELLEAAPSADSDAFGYDLADVARQVLADLGTRVHKEIVKAYQTKNKNALRAAGKKMLGLIKDMDTLLATRREFLMGVWLRDAKKWGKTPAEKKLCERNARLLVTLWVSESGSVNDYANREWSGLLKSFYYPRWKMWMKALSESLEKGKPIDEDSIRKKIVQWELRWAGRNNKFPDRPHGNTLAVARNLWAKYSGELNIA